MALVPPAAAFTYRADGAPGIGLNLFDLAEFSTAVDGEPVRLTVETGFPIEGSATLTVEAKRAVSFELKIRRPEWAGAPKAIGSEPLVTTDRDGWLVIPARAWLPGRSVQVSYAFGPRLIRGDHTNVGKAALAWGPYILAYDTAENPGLPAPALVGFADTGDQPPVTLAGQAGEPLRFTGRVRTVRSPEPVTAIFKPFTEAGATGGRYSVWLRAPGAVFATNASLFSFADEARNEPGNVSGSITDGDPGTFVVTFNGRPQAEAWFVAESEAPLVIRRLVFAHGQNFHDGGWFDSAAGKPRVEIRRTKDSAWESVGELADYPAATAQNNAGIRAGQEFSLRLAEPVSAVAMRVIGKPASGDNPAQAFASCGELEAFAE
jgi:hypothetical protein